MNDVLASNPLIQAIGSALVAFLWQGAAIGAVTFALAVGCRRAAAQTRYLLGCFSLAALMVTPTVTAARQLRDARAAGRQATPVAFAPSAPGEARLTVALTTDLPPDPCAPISSRMPFVVIAWGIGVIVFGGHLLRGGVIVRRIRRAGSPLVDPDRIDALRRVARRLGVTRPIRLLESAVTDVPAVIGFLRPAIILPMSALAGLSPSHLEAILAHELAHIRRGDYLVNVIQRIVETLLFYHPAVWWVSAWIGREREHCCDDVAASMCESRVAYAHALRALEELRHMPMSLAMGARGGDLVSRIRRLVGGAPDPLPNWSGGVAMIVPALAFISFGTVAAPVTMPPPPPQPVVVQATESPRQVAAPSDASAPPAASAGRFAAQPLAQLSGMVEDPSGGMLPGATVTLRSQATSDVRTVTTTVTGNFAFSDLEPGEYNLEVSLSGFKRNQIPINLAPGARPVVRTAMQLGTVAEEITVSAPLTPPLPTDVLPAQLLTAPDYRAAAKFYYVREAFSDAEAMIDRANELTSAEHPVMAAPVAMSQPGVVRVGGSIKEPRKIQDVRPIYPAVAIASGMEGVVTIRAIITRDGTVGGAVITSGGSVFDTAALDAVRQWLFTPTELNNMPVEVLMDVTIAFKKS